MSGRGRGGEAMPRPDRRSAQKAKEKITIAVKHMERETRKATRERNKIKKKNGQHPGKAVALRSNTKEEKRDSRVCATRRSLGPGGT